MRLDREFLSCVGLLVLTLALSARAGPSISILYTGNLLGTALPLDASSTNEVTAAAAALDPSSCVGGAARRQAYIQAKVAVNNASGIATLVLDGGGSFWGSLMYSQFSTGYMARLMAQVGYHASSLANPDFYAGPGVFGGFIDEFYAAAAKNPAHLPRTPRVICSNIDVSKEPKLAGKVSPYEVFEFPNMLNGGSSPLRVGVFGIVDASINSRASPGPNITLNLLNNHSGVSATTIANAMVRQLRSPQAAGGSGCHVVVMLTNLIGPAALDLALNVTGADVVLTSLYDRTTVPRPPITEFPVIAQTYASSPTLPEYFLMAGVRKEKGPALAEVSLNLTSDGRVLWSEATAKLVTLTQSTQTPANGNPSAWATVSQLDAEMNLAQQQTLTTVNVFVSGVRGSNYSVGFEGCGFNDCPMGRIVTDALLSSCLTCDISLYNSGGIRFSFQPGNVTTRDALSVLPFKNQAVTFSANGTIMLSILQHSTKVPGSTLQVGNMRYAWNPSKAEILEVQVWNKVSKKYEALDLAKTYRVVTNNFLRNGGEGYTMMKNDVFDTDDNGPVDASVLISYLKQFSVLPSVTVAELVPCFTTAAIPLDLGAGVCRMVATSRDSDLRLKCSSQTAVCNSFARGEHESQRLDGLAAGEIVPGFFVNPSQCDRCTGVGTCVDRKCACRQPQTGLFAAQKIVTGEDCGSIRVNKPVPIGFISLLYIFAVLTALVSVGVLIGLLLQRDHPAIKATSPAIGALTCLGGLLAACSILTLAQQSNDATAVNRLCQSWLWLTVLAFTLMFTSLFVRTWRINAIFNSQQLQRKVITDLYLLTIIGGIVGLDLVVLTYWQIQSPLQAVGILVTSDETRVAIVCGSDLMSTLTLIFFLFKGVLMLSGVYLAWQTRKVSENWNESKHIGICVYNSAVFSCISIPIIQLVSTSYPEVNIALKGVVTGYTATFTLLVLYGQRLYYIYTGAEMNDAAATSNAKAHNRNVPANIASDVTPPSTGTSPGLSRADTVQRIILPAATGSPLPQSSPSSSSLNASHLESTGTHPDISADDVASVKSEALQLRERIRAQQHELDELRSLLSEVRASPQSESSSVSHNNYSSL